MFRKSSRIFLGLVFLLCGSVIAQREHTLTGDVRLHKSFHSAILNNDRDVIVYLPPGYDADTKKRYPVFYMHDGQNLFDGATSFIPGQEWRADEVAQSLIAAGKIESLIIVGIPASGMRAAVGTLSRRGAKAFHRQNISNKEGCEKYRSRRFIARWFDFFVSRFEISDCVHSHRCGLSVRVVGRQSNRSLHGKPDAQTAAANLAGHRDERRPRRERSRINR